MNILHFAREGLTFHHMQNSEQTMYMLILCMLMPWFHVLPDHQQQCYLQQRNLCGSFTLQMHFHYLHPANQITHCGRATHICISKLTIIDSDNGLLPGRHQDIIWTNGGMLLIGPLGKIFSEVLIETITFSFENAFESVVWETPAIFPWPECVNMSRPGQNDI